MLFGIANTIQCNFHQLIPFCRGYFSQTFAIKQEFLLKLIASFSFIASVCSYSNESRVAQHTTLYYSLYTTAIDHKQRLFN